MQITKEFKFEMAHKLSKSYTCKCQHIHGHSYRALVTLKSKSLNDENVVVDFTKVKEVLNPLIETLDHNFMIHKEDKSYPELLKLAEQGHYPLIVADANPTAEFIAGVLCCALEPHFGTKGMEVEVEVFETATSSAKVNFKDIHDLELSKLNTHKHPYDFFAVSNLTVISSKEPK